MSTPETLYQRAGILLSDVPNFERQGTLSDVEDQWLAAAIAVIESASKIVTVPDVLEILTQNMRRK
jgi:hypothetical protein